MFLIGLVALFCVDYFGNIIPPKIIGAIIDGVEEGQTFLPMLTKLILMYLIISFINFSCRFLWRIAFFTVARRVARDLRHRMFENSLTLSQTFYDNNKVGGLMSYYINDIGAIRETFGWGTLMVFDTLFLVPLVLYEMFKINYVVTLIMLIPLLIIMVASIIVGNALEERYKTRQDKFEELSDFTQESISGIRVIKAFVQEARELKDFKKKNKENELVNMRYLRLEVIFNQLIELFIWSMFFAILAIGAYFVNSNPETFTIGGLTELIAYFDTLLWPMFAIGEIINIRSKGKASLTRVDEILNTKTDLIDRDESLNKDEFKGVIEFKNLTFKFPDDKSNITILNDVSFKINNGDFVGIIGRTGSSKTTLVNLLLRRYNIDDNMIFIDGYDIMSYNVKDLRRHFGYVPQDNFLYSTTVKENIAFSSDTVDMDKVIECAKIAGVHDDILGFEKGYDTKLGERGVSVSGGQKQRISIARALYMNPDILILDDALSAVDTKTESDILKYLKENRKGKTTILIAHRISSIKDADKILVLDIGGKVSGYDNHDNLMKNNSIYKETYNLQKLEKEGGVERV